MTYYIVPIYTGYMLILIILGQLMDGPSHGYAIKQTLDRILGMRKKISWGSLYPILGKLEKELLIKKVISQRDGGPTQKIYSITPKGERRFLELMIHSDYDSGDARTIFRYKLLFFNKIKPGLRTEIVKGYQQYCLDSMKAVGQHLEELKKQKSKKTIYILEVLKHSLEVYRLEKEWTDKLLKL